MLEIANGKGAASYSSKLYQTAASIGQLSQKRIPRAKRSHDYQDKRNHQDGKYIMESKVLVSQTCIDKSVHVGFQVGTP